MISAMIVFTVVAYGSTSISRMPVKGSNGVTMASSPDARLLMKATS
ncbi:hypothetical protein LCGC14_1204130, partial [marine sediment metagenome]